MKNKEQFFYELYCNQYGKAFFTSLKKAIILKDYLVDNYRFEILKEFKPTSQMKFDAEYKNNNSIQIKKQPLNIY